MLLCVPTLPPARSAVEVALFVHAVESPGPGQDLAPPMEPVAYLVDYAHALAPLLLASELGTRGALPGPTT